MRLFVMRHGEAELMANSDKERHLNANGKEQSLMQGTWLKSTALSFDKVLVSPYARALETFVQINSVYDLISWTFGMLLHLMAIRESWGIIFPS